jgi:hypothetical protein
MSSSENLFPHRSNADGTNDSICGTCFGTVGSGMTEAELGLEESKHACDQALLARRRNERGLLKRENPSV